MKGELNCSVTGNQNFHKFSFQGKRTMLILRWGTTYNRKHLNLNLQQRRMNLLPSTNCYPPVYLTFHQLASLLPEEIAVPQNSPPTQTSSIGCFSLVCTCDGSSRHLPSSGIHLKWNSTNVAPPIGPWSPQTRSKTGRRTEENSTAMLFNLTHWQSGIVGQS